MFSPHFTARLLPISIVILLICALFVPIRWMGWARPLGSLATTLAAPISHPFAAISRYLAPAESTPQMNETIKELEKRLEEAERELRRVQAENKRLTDSLEAMNVLSAVNNAPVKQIFAPVFATSSDLSSPLIRVRAGRAEGVDTSSVATAGGLQLLGRVVSVDERTCDVMPCTAKGAGTISTIILLDRGPDGLACQLTPTGTGTLRGPAEDRRDPMTGASVEIAIGQVVRLADGTWPQAAQMLLVGKVVAVETMPEAPLRKIVTVQPTIERLERVSEVVIRTSLTSLDDTSHGAGAERNGKADGGRR